MKLKQFNGSIDKANKRRSSLCSSTIDLGKMSYPAACRAYERRKKALLDLIQALKIKGINVDDLLREVENDKIIEALSSINSRLDLDDLKTACEGWSGSYENMKEEEQEWYELMVEEEEDQDGKMYGGLSDDWEEYLDMINHDQTND